MSARRPTRRRSSHPAAARRLGGELARLLSVADGLCSELERALEGELDPAERSSACADLERLVRASERLSRLMKDLAPPRRAGVAETLAQLLGDEQAEGTNADGRDVNGPRRPGPDAQEI